MNIVDTTPIEACTDCLIFVANGEMPEGRENLAQDIEREWPHVATDETCDFFKAARGTLRNDIVFDGEDLGFSWRECECCGSRLGGDRHRLNVLLVRL